MVLVRRFVACMCMCMGVVGATAVPSASAATNCGSVATERGVWRIQTARNVSCRYAKMLVKRSTAGRDQPVGWRCQGGGSSGLLACGASGNRRVTAKRVRSAQSFQRCKPVTVNFGPGITARVSQRNTTCRFARDFVRRNPDGGLCDSTTNTVKGWRKTFTYDGEASTLTLRKGSKAMRTNACST